MVPIRHANGLDWWIVGQTMEGQFVSYLLSSTGISRSPVVSQPGRALSYNNGVLRASTDGRTVVVSTMEGDVQRAFTSVECGQFDPATGSVTSSYLVKRWPGVVTRTSSSSWTTTYTPVGGLEISPDGAALYVDTVGANYVMRFNLRAGSPAAVTASRVTIRPSGASVFTTAGDLQLGPDGNIYVNQQGSGWLGRIVQPGAAAPTAPYTPAAVALGSGRQCLSSLPFALYDPNPFPIGISGPLAGCIGQVMSFSALGLGQAVGSTVTWNFGDPASGLANTASTPTATHTYAAAGTFTLTLTVRDAAGRTIVATQQVVVSAPLVVSLGPAVHLLCGGQSVTLAPNAQPAGTTYAWQDGSTSPTLLARQPGLYTLTVTNAQGCSAQASTRVELLPTPQVSLGPDTTVCFQQPYLLRPRGAQPAGTVFRWQDGSTGATFLVQGAGRYTLEANSPNGCSARATVIISDGNCPVELPDIITPNGDQQNEFFVLKGLNAPEWRIEIYNRWGRKLYQNERYDNSWNAPDVANGVYFYRLLNPATGQQYKGWLEVVR
jgi:gliding motility-associated-like protein